MVIKNNFYLVFFFFLALNLSCEKKIKVKDTLAESEEEIEQQKRDSVFKVINRERANKFEDNFNYPKDKLFLGFYSGMNEMEFNKRRDSLLKKGVLYKKFSGLYYYNVSDIMNLPGLDYIYISPEFDSNKNLLSIQLKNIGSLSSLYSKKYNIPTWKKKSRINVSKIGTYNKSYDPLEYIINVTPTEKRKAREESFHIPKKQKLPVPKEFIDKAKKLGFFESQVYYNKKANSNDLKSFEKVIQIDENTIIVYQKYWELLTSSDYSIPIDQIPLEAQFGYLNLRERQSNQIIETKYWKRYIDVMYTTKQYYQDLIKAKNEESDIPVKSKRDISDEI